MHSILTYIDLVRNVVSRRSRFDLFSSCCPCPDWLVSRSKRALQPRRSDYDIQTINTTDASSQPISPTLCPWPLISICAKKRQKPDDRNKCVFILWSATCFFTVSISVDLAVIFRPGLISHPRHEMSPTEHALSQRVLEFLIAQQDWFMLDIPPPPPNELANPGSATIPAEAADVDVFPSSDDEPHSGTGWRLVGKDRKVARRKTTLDHHGKPRWS